MPRRETTAADYERRLLRVQQAIAEHLDEPLDPAALAATASFSLHHFHRIFRGQMGESVMQHVRRLRLERAARRLRADGGMRLIDLALEAGYESHEAFTRAFTDAFGVAPSLFRERAMENLLPKASTAASSVEVRVAAYPALRVAFFRHRGGFATVGETWGRLVAWAEARGLLAAWPCLYGLCPDDPEITDEDFLRFDACVVVPDGFDEPEVAFGEVPAGTYAVGLHVGPYERLHETYLDVIGRWFPQSGYELSSDAVVEHYRNDPRCTPAERLETEVRVRILD